jgi:hypothetical protein
MADASPFSLGVEIFLLKDDAVPRKRLTEAVGRSHAVPFGLVPAVTKLQG